MKIKTSELTDAALDWAAAKCEGRLPASYDDWKQTWPHYSTDWAQGGPIIAREGITLRNFIQGARWDAEIDDLALESGPTPLIAAMRCLCASKLGDEVEVPDELA